MAYDVAVTSPFARAAIVLSVLGGTLGVALDGWHVLTGTTAYAHPTALGIATWTLPLFAAAGLGVGWLPVVRERRLGLVVTPASRSRALVALGLFVLAYLASGLLRGLACAIVLAALSVAIWLAGDRAPVRIALAHAVAAGLSGVLVEATLVHLHAFRHADTRLFGVAPWLPLLYACGSLALTCLARTVAPPQRAAWRMSTTPSGSGG